MICQACGIQQMTDARFCEDCGAALCAPVAGASAETPADPAADPSACGQCGAGPGAIAADGFCTRCGHERIDAGRNHVEISISPLLAGVTDIGLKHFRNEDALALDAGPGGEALVVCDGVSRSQNPDLASARAAGAALEVLRGSVSKPLSNHMRDVIAAALEAARAAVASIAIAPSVEAEPPETTIIVALRRGRQVSLGWVGDSRAYFIAAASAASSRGQDRGHDARQCTLDHSWLNETVAAGGMSLAEAMLSPLAHALTRSLGGPLGSSEEPSQLDFDLPAEAGHLVLCSDGLWNYLPDPSSLAVLIEAQPGQAGALALARALVDYARDRGGRDNITVAVLICTATDVAGGQGPGRIESAGQSRVAHRGP